MVLLHLNNNQTIGNQLCQILQYHIKIIGLSEDESRPPFKFNGAWLSVNNRAIVHIVENNDHVYENKKPTLDHIAFRVLDIEKMKNDPVVQAKFYQALDIIYENLYKVTFSVSDFFRS